MPREINTIPFANNDLASDYLFNSRKYYVSDESVYLQGPGIPKPVDIWYDRPLWGKVDQKQRYIIPGDEHLKPISDELSAMNFVADAYHDFKNYAIAARNSLKTSMTSFIDIGNPKKAYEDVVLQYQDYFVDFLEQEFANRFITDQKRATIDTFNDYSKLYMRFFDINSSIPHTMVGYLSSNFVSYRASGLIIEFSTDDYDKDEIKWEDFLSNDFFEDFTKISGNFGFYVNKHVPWAIVANFNSKGMRRYMLKYNLKNASDVFKGQYYPAEYISYNSFKNYMFLSYSSFLRRYPVVEKVSINNCIRSTFMESSYKTKRQLSLRPNEFSKGLLENDIDFDSFLKEYGEMYFIKLYTKIRLAEEGIDLRTKEYNNLLMKIHRIMKKHDIVPAFTYFSNFLASKREKKFFALTREKRFDIISSRKNTFAYKSNSGGSLRV